MLACGAHEARLVVIRQQHTRAEGGAHHVVRPHADCYGLAAVAEILLVVGRALRDMFGILIQCLQCRVASTDNLVGIDPGVVQSPVRVRVLVAATIAVAEQILLVVVTAGSHIIIATGPHQVVHPMHAGPAKLGVRAYHRLIHLGSLGVIDLRTGDLVLGIYLQKRATCQHCCKGYNQNMFCFHIHLHLFCLYLE